ncbi:hypothetical protein HS088_TW12G01137 [Tripterygium wilfordii]|uniref:Pectinesterase inhibitor domain-containing protein n=2 Tax=Tripterygium wilfordii TaxID=458696 RepID=A0A7J7D0S1_TRIWF|nr:hypothetical protein HS088_TW12G01137 [Tripterygium wilfordii]
MEEYGFCDKTFNQNLKGPTADYVDLTLITIEQSLLNASNTNTYIERLGRSTKPGALKNALIECNNVYNSIMQSFRNANMYYKQKNYNAMIMSESVTPRLIESCITCFLTPPLHPMGPLETMNRQMRMLCSMALVTGHQLQSKKLK